MDSYPIFTKWHIPFLENTKWDIKNDHIQTILLPQWTSYGGFGLIYNNSSLCIKPSILLRMPPERPYGPIHT
jgi:hypothetical protein